MHKLLLTLSFIFVCSCTFQNDRPKENIINNKTTIEMANEDYNAVIEGKLPLHAIFDDKHAIPADGGTTFYKGNGYKLEIRKRLTDENNTTGFIYGPIITFDNPAEIKTDKEMSHLKFYKDEELRKFLGESIQQKK